MPMVRRETDFDICFLLYDIDSTEHDALDKTVHGESLDFGSLEHSVLHSVRQYKGCCIEEQAEIVCTVGIARHAVCLEIL